MGYPNGVTTTYTYNPASYLTSLLAQKPQSTVNSFAYTHDAVGNRISLTDFQGIHAYQYDPIYQLTQAVHPNIPAEQFSYDPAGNRLDAQFDEAGGIKVNTSYTYDFENRLIRVQYPGMDAQYKYDPLGRRTEKDVNGEISRFVYDGDNIIVEYDGTGAVKSRYLFNRAIDDPLSVEQGGSIYYYHKDGLGSITELTDSTGTVVKTYRYNSFGEIYAQSGSFNQPFTFTGREYDPESGLYYYRARYYDPVAGRFLTRDPIKFKGGINLYNYVRNNPINRFDPCGLKGCGPFGISIKDPWELEDCCNEHDNCYEECFPSISRTACDDKFCVCLKGKCDKVTAEQREACNSRSEFYCFLVKTLGWISDMFCTCPEENQTDESY